MSLVRPNSTSRVLPIQRSVADIWSELMPKSDRISERRNVMNREQTRFSASCCSDRAGHPAMNLLDLAAVLESSPLDDPSAGRFGGVSALACQNAQQQRRAIMSRISLGDFLVPSCAVTDRRDVQEGYFSTRRAGRRLTKPNASCAAYGNGIRPGAGGELHVSIVCAPAPDTVDSSNI